jgi:hypothetical protein
MFPVDATKADKGRWGKSPLIINIGTSRPLYSRVRTPVRFEEEKSLLLLPTFEDPTVQPLALSSHRLR